MLRDLDLDLGSSQGHVNIQSVCRTPNMPNRVTVASTHYRNMAIWISSNIDIGQSLNSRDSFPRRKFKNRAPTSCSPGPILWPPTIRFELHAKTAEEIDLEMCSYGQLSEVQMLRDLDLDLGSSHGHVNIQSVCRTTNMPNRVTVASTHYRYRNMAIWISSNIDIGQSLNSRDSFPRRKFKNRAVVQVPYYGHQPSGLSSTPKRRRR